MENYEWERYSIHNLEKALEVEPFQDVIDGKRADLIILQTDSGFHRKALYRKEVQAELGRRINKNA